MLYGRNARLPLHLLTGEATPSRQLLEDENSSMLANWIANLQLSWGQVYGHLRVISEKRNGNDMTEHQTRALRRFEVGDAVLRYINDKRTKGLKKGAGHWMGPYLITKELLPTTYEMQGTGLNGTNQKEILVSWSGHLKRYSPQIPDLPIVQAQMTRTYALLSQQKEQLAVVELQNPLLARFAADGSAPLLKGSLHEALDETIRQNFIELQENNNVHH